jgi:hypothetical protein
MSDAAPECLNWGQQHRSRDVRVTSVDSPESRSKSDRYALHHERTHAPLPESKLRQRLGGVLEPAPAEGRHAIGIVHVLIMKKRDGVADIDRLATPAE